MKRRDGRQAATRHVACFGEHYNLWSCGGRLYPVVEHGKEVHAVHEETLIREPGWWAMAGDGWDAKATIRRRVRSSDIAYGPMAGRTVSDHKVKAVGHAIAQAIFDQLEADE